MITMKKTPLYISLTLVAGLMLASCGKKTDPPPKPKTGITATSMTFTLNGKVMTFNECEAALGGFQGLNLINGHNIDPTTGDVSGKTGISIDLEGEPNIYAGETFTGAQFNASQGLKGGFINYTDSNGVLYIPDDQQTVSTIIITSLTSNYIKGTFSGVVYADSQTVKNSYTITNGSFTASITQVKQY